MSNTATVLAFDFGASSGRAIRAVYDGQNLTYEEIHRFENVPIEKGGHLFWDVETLLKEIHTAIQKAGTFDSLGFDTWGVDFGLLDADGHLLANPVHYRDARTNGKPEQAAARMPAEELYAHTGNQIMAINTLFQLLALRAQREQYVSSLLGIADTELTLGGRKAIARWYEVYGYDDAMVQEAAVQAGPKRDLWYWNSILKTWNAKGLRTVHDVRGPVAGMGASRNLRVDRAEPSGNDFLKNAARRRPLRKKTDTPAE